MRITNLPASSSFASNDVLAIEINGKTYKLTGATLAAAVQSIGSFVTSSDVVTTTTDGLMTSSDKVKLNGIASGAQVNTITGVKGNSESSYRTGNVNLTPGNIGALAPADVVNDLTSGGTTVPLSAEMGKQINKLIKQIHLSRGESYVLSSSGSHHIYIITGFVGNEGCVMLYVYHFGAQNFMTVKNLLDNTNYSGNLTFAWDENASTITITSTTENQGTDLTIVTGV